MADKHADVEGTKLLRREFNKRQLDTSMCDMRVSHGVAYVRGTIKAMPGAGSDVREMVEHAARALRTRPEIRDIVIDVTYRS